MGTARTHLRAKEFRLGAGRPRRAADGAVWSRKHISEDSPRYHARLKFEREWHRKKLLKLKADPDPSEYRYHRLVRVLRGRGITLDQYHAKMEKQNWLCAICGDDLSDKHGREVHIDHDHATGRFRGLLCPSCNTGIGKLKESPAVLTTAAAYLTPRSELVATVA